MHHKYTIDERLGQIMRLRRVDIIIIAVTFAFICFMGGYFAGSKSAVSILGVDAQRESLQQHNMEETHSQANNVSGERVQSSGELISTAVDNSGYKADNNVAQFESSLPESSTTASPTPESNTQEANKIAVGAPRSGDTRININTASKSELMDLPGVGEVIAGRIIDYRSQNGAFLRVEDIMKVSGIGEKRFEALKDKITVG